MEYDAIVIGGGPAGLTAGTLLAQAKTRVLLLDKESFGGRIMKVESVINYPAENDKISGPALGAEFLRDARDSGVQMELADVVKVTSGSSRISIGCADGRTYTARVAILAGGVYSRKMGVPGEDRYLGRGMIDCALREAELYRDRVVAVCGGGYAGVIEALYFAKYAAKVYVIEMQPELTAKPVHQERARANPRMEVLCGEKAVEVVGEDSVKGLVVENVASGRRQTLDVHGVLVQVGFAPVTGFLQGTLPLDDQGRIVVNGELETGVPGILAAGDIRKESPRRTAAAVADGKTAAASAMRILKA